MRYDIRPLGQWTGAQTANRQSSGRFRAKWQSTLDLLGRETELLGAHLVVLRIDVRDGDIRRDGMLAARARVGHPGVRVSFDSVHGPLTYATDTYEQIHAGDPPGWQANVRAVALALEALRAVDRYGVSRSGEQYRGWTAIGNGQTEMTVAQAVQLLAEGAEAPADQVRTDPQAAYRAAARRHHPDRGGDNDLFARLTDARDVLVGDHR